ncbi:MAG: DUF885 domain-containing protein [Pseudomonadota bacterium]
MIQQKSGLIAALILVTMGAVSCDMSVRQPGGENTSNVRETRAILEEIAEEELRRAPELASRLGISVNSAGFDYTSILDDRSQAAFERARLRRIETLQRLNSLPQRRLTPQLLKDRDIVTDAFQSVIKLGSFGHGQVSFAYARPFVADHLSGAYIDLQDILLFRQIVTNSESVDAFLARFESIANSIDDDRRRLLADAAAGVSPPDFILENMIEQATLLRSVPAEGPHPLISAFQRRLVAVVDLSEDEKAALVIRAQTEFDSTIAPAYDRLIDSLSNLKVRAPAEPGIWQIENGSDYYIAALELYGGKPLNPDELHREGLSIVANLQETLDAKFTDLGYIEGTVGQRIAALSDLDGQVMPNDDEGRLALIEQLNGIYTAAADQLSEIIPDSGLGSVLIEPVPETLQASSPGAYYTAAPANGTSPAVFNVNLLDTADWPAFTLPALVFHETIPGHHLESSYPSARRSLIRQMIWPVVYGEGWALYAEDVAYELGLYSEDPLAEIGYLQSLLFRAARLVTDTGIHHQRWSRDEAVDYLVSVTGFSETAMMAEVDRYTVWPGQAVAYMIGRNEIIRLRNRAEEVLGSRFELTEFHDAILSGGPRPFKFVEQDIDAWIASELAP